MTPHPIPRSAALDQIDALAKSIADHAAELQQAVEDLRRQDQARGDGNDPAD